jgi:hypothetical protein
LHGSPAYAGSAAGKAIRPAVWTEHTVAWPGQVTFGMHLPSETAGPWRRRCVPDTLGVLPLRHQPAWVHPELRDDFAELLQAEISKARR